MFIVDNLKAIYPYTITNIHQSFDTTLVTRLPACAPEMLQKWQNIEQVCVLILSLTNTTTRI